MNISNNLTIACSLGLLAALGSATLGEGDADSGIGVEIINFPDDIGIFGNPFFSSDGELRMVYDFSQIYSYESGQWTLALRELDVQAFATYPVGISRNGSRYVIDGSGKVSVVDGLARISLPRMWPITEEISPGHDWQTLVWGSISGGGISGNGKVVTMGGLESGRSKFDSLVWMGGSELINISDGLPRGDESYAAGLPNENGSVIVFGTGVNDLTDESHVWVWHDGERIEIPRLDPLGDGFHEYRAISADGLAVFGTDGGVARGALNYSEPLIEPQPWTQPTQSQATAWVWTAQSGTVPIIDRNRFLETAVVDINADGSVMLGSARAFGTNDWEQFLWFGGDDFVMVNDLLNRLGLTIDAETDGFYEISDDGSKLMGSAFIDGRYAALIVTIPVRGRVISGE